MTSYGFYPKFPPAVMREAEQLPDGLAFSALPADVRDLRALLWSSIDNAESQDLDQVEYCERGANDDIHVLVAIADVDHWVAKDSLTDAHAAHNATSVYTGVETFPMIPERMCHNLTSLKEGEDRLAVVLDYFVAADGQVRFNDVYRAVVQNKAKLIYESAGDWLEGRGPAPEAIKRVGQLKEQLFLQDEAANRLRQFRISKGALELDTIEASPLMNHEIITDLVIKKKNRARYLIENFMIAANTTMNWFLEKHNVPCIDRVLKTPLPQDWKKLQTIAKSFGETLSEIPDPLALSQFLIKRHGADPDHFPDLSLAVVKILGAGEYVRSDPGKTGQGHFGLAIQDYTHSTAPNRRYVDLIIQRLLKSVCAQKKIPYTMDKVTSTATWCTQQSQAAKKVERFMRKVAAAVLLMDRVGEVFEGIVTGASEKGIYVRVFNPPVEGRVIRKFDRMDVGERVRVRLINMDPERGYIDFEGVH